MSAQLASLQDALEERKVIDKAKSILMNYQQVSEEQAWQLLRKMAMDKNQRMVDIARALLTVKSLMQGIATAQQAAVSAIFGCTAASGTRRTR